MTVETFHVRVDGEPERSLAVETSIYQYAAAAVPAMLADASVPCTVEIWVPRLLPEYGPYLFRVGEDDCGRLVVHTLGRVDGQSVT